MPLKTLEATASISDVDSVTLDEDPAPVLAELESIGIDMHQVTEDLLDAGIDAFVHSLDGLIEGIEKQGGSAE
jgi:transaldolase